MVELPPMKLIKKDCGKHSGHTGGKCNKCEKAYWAHMPSSAACLEGTIKFSDGSVVEFTATGKI